MSNSRSTIGAVRIDGPDKGRGRATAARPGPAEIQERPQQRSYLGVGAKALAGIGLGLAAVLAFPAVIGLATEAVLIPSLLLKFAGGMAGGGIGLAKGLTDERKHR